MIIRSRKGMEHEMFFTAFELMLVAVIGLALFNFINSAAAGSIYEKSYLSKDMALTVNALYAAPGEVVYNYNENVKLFILDFKPGKLEVYRKDEGQLPHAFYLYAEDTKAGLRYKTLDGSEKNLRINFQKSPGFLEVSGNEK